MATGASLPVPAAGQISPSGVSRQLDSDRGQLPDARHWPGKATMGGTNLHSEFFAEPGRGASPFQRALPESRHASGVRDLLVLRCFATTNVEAAAGTGAIRSTSAKLPRLMSSVFRYRFFPPTKGFAAACFIHEATWCSSRSSTDASSTPRVDLPIPIGVTGGSGLISVPRMNISFR